MINNKPYSTPPIYIALQETDEEVNFNPEWINYFNSLTQQLNSSLTPYGNVMPALSTTNAAATASSSTQKVIYNSDLNVFQGNISGEWKTFTTITLLNNNQLNSFAGSHQDNVQLVYDTDNDEIYIVRGNIKFRLQKV